MKDICDANGMELSAEDIAMIEDITKTDGDFAAEYTNAGFADADTYLQYYFGDGADAAAYQEYYEVYLQAARAYQARQEVISAELTEDEIMAYYNEQMEKWQAEMVDENAEGDEEDESDVQATG